MAFNPFRAFRKHQKVMFAALTILCMGIFVLSGSMSAGWDFFMGFGELFGFSSHRAGMVSVFGKDYDSRQLTNIRRWRDLVNQYMSQAAMQAYSKTQMDARPLLDSLSRDHPEQAQRLQFLDMQSGDPMGQIRPEVFLSPNYQAQVRQIIQMSKKPEAAALIQQIMRLRLTQALMGRRLEQILRGRTLYFGGPRTMDTNELVDFLIWRHEADRQGIRFSEDDIADLVNKETGNLLSSDDFRMVDNSVRGEYGNFGRTDFLSALGDEFRVRAAQEARGFSEGGQRVEVTPYQLWSYYKENRTRARVAMVAVPVRSPEFLAKVGKPTDEDLKKLYDAHKNEQYSPESEHPGFKQPPRVRIEWLHPRPEHFRQSAERAAAVAAAAQLVTAGLRADTIPWEPALPATLDTRLLREYEDTKFIQFRAPSLTSPSFALSYTVTASRPESVTAALGTLVGGAGTGAAAHLAGAIAYEASAFGRRQPQDEWVLQAETQRRARVGLTLLLSATSPVPLAPAAVWTTASSEEQYLPMAAVRGTLASRVAADFARKMAGEIVGQFRDELETISKLKNTDEALQYLAANRPPVVAATVGLSASALASAAGGAAPALLAGAVAQARPRAGELAQQAGRVFMTLGGPLPWNLTTMLAGDKGLPNLLARRAVDRAVESGAFERHTSQSARDAYDVAQDPGLKPLRDAFDLAQNSPDPTGRLFARQFFNDKAEPSDKALYVPQSLQPPAGAGAEETYLYWDIAQQASYVPTFAEARDRIVKAWEAEKARPAAKAAAEELARAAEKGGKPVQNLEDAAKKYGGRVFYLDDIAPLVPDQAPAMMSMQTMRRYGPYQIPEYQRESVEYPSKDMPKDLLALRPEGKVAVFSDEPKAQYYVGTCVWLVGPQISSFYDDYSRGDVRHQLLDFLERDTHYRENISKSLLEELRAQAKIRLPEEKEKSTHKDNVPAPQAPVDDGD